MPEKLTVTVLPTGVMQCDLNWLLLDPDRMLSRRQPERSREWIDCPTHAVLIEHPNGQRMLWDTGLPQDWEARWTPTGMNNLFPSGATTDEQWLSSRLTQLKLEPSDFDFLVLSHLHQDHAANAQWWRDTDTTIVVSEAEKAGALSFDGYNLGGHIRSDYDGLEFTTVNTDTEIMPGVKLLQTPGHTWGTMSLQVDLEESGTMIFASDAIYRSDSFGPPVVGGSIVYDTVAWLDSVEKVRRIQRETNAMVVFGHDAAQMAQLRTGPGNSYT